MANDPLPVEALHREIDGLTRQLEEHHAARLSCKRGCADCCVDGITVFDVEAERIRVHHRELLERGEPHPPGACAFLDGEGACRIYADRPYVCRTQGLPLRWIDDEAMVEQRDICELNEADPPITELEPGECWTIGPAESKLYVLQKERGEVRRVALRDLFSGDGG